jgi:2-amino-4-hydroxy-6-hydroxymethyldihydropteridine diphosphokinase
MAAAVQAFVGLGANLGDRWTNLQAALAALRQTPGILLVVLSPVYESEPVGVVEQPLFLNLVAGIETTLTPGALLHRLLEIEQQLGRQRTLRWGPRAIDLDLLLYAGETRTGPELELPHPRMMARSFVTEPLRELLRLPRFENPEWTALRAHLAALPPGTGLRLWRPD